jgi:hypothetical protein
MKHSMKTSIYLLLAINCRAQTINSMEAKKLMRQPVLSVMSKTEAGPSGDKHDYVSYAPYWWPDPAKPDGLPYIRKDGHTNRELVAQGDANNFSSTAHTIRRLTDAFVAHAEPEFGDNAVRRIVVWFLDPKTRMNPHLNFGQIVKGRNDGRAEGLITLRALIEILDSIRDLEKGNVWPPAEDKAMRDWMAAYHKWLTTSEIGMKEAQARNNHGSWYAAQAMRIEVYLGQKAQAKKRAEDLKKRIAWQFEPDGTQPLEAARADGYSYSVFNLEALANAAAIAKPLGVDLWKFRTSDGRSMYKAFQYLLPYAAGTKPWPGSQLKKIPSGSLAKVRELYEAR